MVISIWETVYETGESTSCENGIVCASLDEKPLAVEVLPLQNIERYEFDPVHMNIYADDGRIFLITTAGAHEIPEILKSREWTQ